MDHSISKHSEVNPEFENVRDVSPEAVKNHIQEVDLIDVRRPDEYDGELGHIANAKLIVLDTLPERFQEIPKDKPVVLICRSGRRSAQASTFLQEQGYDNTYNMQGGMLLWNEKGFPTEK